MLRKNSYFSLFFYTETKESKNYVVFGLLIAMFLYACFAFLDYYMLPKTYHLAWIIRGSTIGGALILLFFLKYWRNNILNYKYIITIVVGIVQLGVALMQYFAQSNEPASWEYYIGYILILVYAAFIFKLSSFIVLLNVILSILLFNIVFHLKLSLLNIPAYNPTYLLNGNFYISAAGFLILAGSIHLNKNSSLLNKRNIELKAEKAELLVAKNKAKETEILKAKFLSNFSHELRTPMNSVLGFCELLSSENISQDEMKQYSDIVFKKGNELQFLIENLIDMSLIDANQLALNLSPTNISEILDTSINNLENKELFIQKRESIKLSVEMDKPLNDVLITSDEFRLSQILDNLITNSVKFTHKGEIKISCQLINEFIEFKIQDTGIGMNKEMLSLVMNPFSRIDHTNSSVLYDGLGLGLKISKRLIELMGGSLWITSEEGIGTKVKFILPAKYLND